MTNMNLASLMGEVVTVYKELYKVRQFNGDTQQTKHQARDVEPRAGWVTGYRTLQEGITLDHYNRYTDSRTFKVTGTVQCLLVVYWPTMNPVRVPLDGYELGGEPESPSVEWKEEYKEDQRKYVQNWPRNEKGQWIPHAEMTEEQEKAWREGWYA